MDYDKIIELDNVTIQDCEELYKFKGIRTVINDGRIVNFKKERSDENY